MVLHQPHHQILEVNKFGESKNIALIKEIGFLFPTLKSGFHAHLRRANPVWHRESSQSKRCLQTFHLKSLLPKIDPVKCSLELFPSLHFNFAAFKFFVFVMPLIWKKKLNLRVKCFCSMHCASSERGTYRALAIRNDTGNSIAESPYRERPLVARNCQIDNFSLDALSFTEPDFPLFWTIWTKTRSPFRLIPLLT